MVSLGKRSNARSKRTKAHRTVEKIPEARGNSSKADIWEERKVYQLVRELNLAQ